VGGELFFVATDKAAGKFRLGLWKSDGTRAGTRLIKPIPLIPGRNLYRAFYTRDLISARGRLLFVLHDRGHGRELWESDGSARGTRLVKDIRPGGRSSNPADLTTVGRRLWFAADDGKHGVRLWESNGTREGTKRIPPVNPRRPAVNPDLLTKVGGGVFFRAVDGSHGHALFETTRVASHR
jgi:ELWxxDGT repeat protein